MQARFFSAGKEITKQIIKTLKDIYPEPSLPKPASPKPTRSSLSSKLKSWGFGLLVSRDIKPKPEEIEARSYLQRVQKLYKEAAERTDKPVDDYVVPFLIKDMQPGGRLASISEVRAIVGSILCHRYLHIPPQEFKKEIRKQIEDNFMDPLFSITEAKIVAALHFIEEYEHAKVMQKSAEVEKSQQIERRY